MKPAEAARIYLQGLRIKAAQSCATAFAPANIALIKYWGKRDDNLNLPQNSSLSLSMGDQGATTTISVHPDAGHDSIWLNGRPVPDSTPFARKIINYLDIIDCQRPSLKIETALNIPVAAGLASSAAGFAALIKALDAFCGWHLPLTRLSCLARLGSGSACRSLWSGFVEWNKGKLADGQDCHATPLTAGIADLRLGLLILEEQEKKVSSREGMRRTVESSPLYSAWPNHAEEDLIQIRHALENNSFQQAGLIAEHNALMMHATMMAACPALAYSTEKTLQAMNTIWQLREKNIPVYFTQDAGPNLKLLFQAPVSAEILQAFPSLRIIIP